MFLLAGSRLINYFDGFWATGAALCIRSPLGYLWEYHPAFVIGWIATLIIYIIVVLLTASKNDSKKEYLVLYMLLIITLLINAFPNAENIINSSCK